jgi:hypothetical protein
MPMTSCLCLVSLLVGKKDELLHPDRHDKKVERVISDSVQVQAMAIIPASIKKRQRLSKTVIAVNKNEEYKKHKCSFPMQAFVILWYIRVPMVGQSWLVEKDRNRNRTTPSSMYSVLVEKKNKRCLP